MSDDYTKKLESIIKQMLRPLSNIPFNLVIESISGCKVIPFDSNDEQDITLLKNLKKVAILACRTINKSGGIMRERPNEVGNDVEKFVRDALSKIGYINSIPKTKTGNKKSTGYPDIEFTDEFGRINYLECKTFNNDNIQTSQRSFYLSPSQDFKVIHDAHHFTISFEIKVAGKRKNKNIYKCVSWKILSLENLDVDVKYEFNSDNKRLYANHLILAEGKIN
ncbi:MAG: type II restriction endonuclease MjaV [Bacteroidia bacterium]